MPSGCAKKRAKKSAAYDQGANIIAQALARVMALSVPGILTVKMTIIPARVSMNRWARQPHLLKDLVTPGRTREINLKR